MGCWKLSNAFGEVGETLACCIAKDSERRKQERESVRNRYLELEGIEHMGGGRLS